MNSDGVRNYCGAQAAEECERRIKNYRAHQGQLDQITDEALENVPWKDL
jgi:hypothetical protein